MASIVILGPAHPLRGGIAAFNERLAGELLSMGHQVVLFSFSLQYPSFLFPGKTQLSDAAAPPGLDIRSTVNTLNPLSWFSTARKIRRLHPEMVITRFWIPFMAPSLGAILRRVRKDGVRIVCIADNVIPHEKRPGDEVLTRYFLRACDAFIAMSRTVRDDLRRFVKAPVSLVPHPVYDRFGEKGDQATARHQLGIDPGGRWLLFFGFIRAYKGLDLLLEALADPEVRRGRVRLLVAGEFYEDEAPYRQLLASRRLTGEVVLYNRFIPAAEVSAFFNAADAVVLPYRSATQSGIAPLAYYFERPMIATGVGGLPEAIPDGVAGIICPPRPEALAAAIVEFYRGGAARFSAGLAEQKKRYSWPRMAAAILEAGGVTP